MRERVRKILITSEIRDFGMDFFGGEGVREGFDKKQTQDSHFYDKRSHQFHLHFFSGTFLK